MENECYDIFKLKFLGIKSLVIIYLLLILKINKIIKIYKKMFC